MTTKTLIVAFAALGGALGIGFLGGKAAEATGLHSLSIRGFSLIIESKNLFCGHRSCRAVPITTHFKSTRKKQCLQF